MLRPLTALPLTLMLIWMLPVAASGAEAGQLVHRIDFTAQPEGSALPWLKDQGYRFELDYKALRPRFEGGALCLSTEQPARGLLNRVFAKGEELRGVKKVRITWGVREFPEGADWESGVNRVAIGVMISFGTERLASGLPFGVSPAPYFVCPFLGEKEPAGKIYTGQFWKKGGRYIACRTPKEGESVTTVVEVDEVFQQCFQKAPTPPITALAIQVNSTDTKGKAEAFVRRIEFLN